MIIFMSDSELFLPGGVYVKLCDITYKELSQFLNNLSEDSTVIIDVSTDPKFFKQIDVNALNNVVFFKRGFVNLEKYRDEVNSTLIRFSDRGISQYVRVSKQLRLPFSDPYYNEYVCSGGIYKF